MTQEWRPDPMANMKRVFDYGSISEQHKEAAEEIAKILANSGNELIANLIKEKFGLVDPVTYDYENTLFTKAAIAAGLYVNVQGTVVEDGIHYQMISLTDDIRKLEKIVPAVISLYEESKKQNKDT